MLFKVKSTDEEVPNCTVICLVLRVLGPLHERTLCTVLLVCNNDLPLKFEPQLLVQGLQIACSVAAFYIRYILLEGVLQERLPCCILS